MRLSLVVAVATVVITLPQRTQTCHDDAYRWSAKVDQSLATLTPKRAYVGTILSSWALPDLWAGNSYNDAPRQGRELSAYYILGWVRRIDTSEDDCDWHIEITSTKTGNADNCVVVEIPKGTSTGLFGVARSKFQTLLGGAPQDRGAKSTNPNGAHSHGHCNSSARALWELHPVYFVLDPTSL